MRVRTFSLLMVLMVVALGLVAGGCQALSKLTTSVAGTAYSSGVPQGAHVILVGFDTKTQKYAAQTQTGHFIIQGVEAGEYVLRALDMRAIPMGGGTYIKVLPGRPVTELKFEIWDIVPPPEGKEGSMTREEFIEAFGLFEREAAK